MKGGLLGGLIIALHPLSIRYGTLLLNDFPALTLALIGFYMLNRSYKNVNLAKNRVKTENGFWNTYQRILFAGVCLGLAVSIKLIMAPIFVAFFIIIIIEGHIDDISLNTRAKTIGILVLGFVITVGAILTPFLLIAKDAFIDQILGQHLSKTSYPGVTWLSRIGYAPSRYWDVDKILLIILLLSIPFALKNRYGRGLIVIAAILIIAIILLVPRPHLNYYDMHLPTIAMVCGYFPLSISTLLNLRKKFQWNRVVISQILGWILIVGYIFTIALSPSNNIQPMDEESFKAVQWLKANTDQDEYILCDDTNINIMAQRRGPFAEVSIDRMDLGRQTTDMLIQSLYDYNIRIVVVTGRLFGRFPVYDAFMEFLEVNYTKIEMGFSIYVRDSPLI